MVMIDTDILIDYMREDQAAIAFIQENQEIAISTVTVLEILNGARNKQELNKLDKLLSIF